MSAAGLVAGADAGAEAGTAPGGSTQRPSTQMRAPLHSTSL
jgi:hypothetical protein